jgi:glucose/arabinose dehydrogenase
VENRLVLLAWLLTAVSLTLLCPRVFGEVTGLTRVATGFESPVFVTHAPGDPDNLFVVEQEGLVRVFNRNTGVIASTPLLDIQSLVEHGGDEEGLLGLAFHPDFATNGKFYVNYINPPGGGTDRTRVDEFTVSSPGESLVANVSSRRPILSFVQDFDNHNGGWLGFSPNDGMLYISSGDGGSGNDPNNRGQSLNTRLGKMLRIDVDGDDFTDANENFAIPADNPFANDGNANTLGEIWAYGLRNPWRASFDRVTGDLWIGDVGQGTREEIDFQPGDSDGGENYGWRLREGNIATPNSVGGPEPPGYVGPVYDYLSNGVGPFGGNSVVGGYVYRGPDPEVDGRYFFGDTVNNHIWSFYRDGDDEGTAVDQLLNLDTLLTPDVGSRSTITSFGEDSYGNLYVVARGGDIFRIVTDATMPGDFNGDRLVDAADYEVWKQDFGSSDSLDADGNGDGVVDLADYTVWRDNLGAEFGSFAAVETSQIPEPNTLAACGILVGLIWLYGQRRC